MRHPAALMAVLAAAAFMAGCSQVVSGVGRNGLSTRPSAPASGATSCPHVAYPAARLSFDCIASGMALTSRDPVWPLSEERIVEPTTKWVLEEGAGHWGSPDGASLAFIAANVRRQMISIGGYGVNPAAHTVASHATTVDGAPAYLLQTTVTINPAWARSFGTKVKQEKLWIIAIRVGPNDVSLWYTSLPDLVASLWPKVPATIASIKVG